MTAAPQIATAVRPAGHWQGAPKERLELAYDARFVRRKRLSTASGALIVVDLPETTNLQDGDALVLDGGGLVEVRAAPEPLLRVAGPDLARLAWHIGNRHTPCQIARDHLLIQRDHVLADMLRGLGAALDEVEAPFRPEGGAYGMGRTMGHSHGPAEGHSHGHGDGHSTADTGNRAAARAHLAPGDFDGGE